MAIRIENTEENQFDLVLNLLTQQDEVILKLDELNVEIESLIEQLAAERKAELGIVDENGQFFRPANTIKLFKAA